ncbi:MAG: hypothetical protein H5U13_01220 [Parvibaculum sp.]|nr:hypothetical protein [Parvibaculum sp.]
MRSRIALRVAAALLPLCLAAGVAQYVNTVHNRELRERALIARGEAAIAHQSTALQELRILLETISALPLGDHAGGEVCSDAFRRIILQNKDVSSLHLVGVDGKTLCRAPAMATGDEEVPLPEWVGNAVQSQQFSIWMQRSDDAGSEGQGSANARLVATLPIYGPDRQTTGILAATVPFSSLTLTMQEVELPDAAALALLDAKWNVLAQRTRGRQVDGWLPASFAAAAGPEIMSGTFSQQGRDGLARNYVVAALPGNVFGLYAQNPEELSVAVRAVLYFAIAFPLLVLIAASAFAGRATGQIVIEPLNKVRFAIRRYIAGDDGARVEYDPQATEEVQAVATKFNTMADNIQVRDEALRAALDHQKALVREVNHRVRNNLQVMNSLLNLQSRRAKTPDQAAIFLDVQRRLNALGTVHAALYQANDFRAVDLGVLLKDLCLSTERHLSTEWGRPVLSMRCPEPIYGVPDAALTLAFLVTELIAEATVRLSPEGHPATQIDFELTERPGRGSTLIMKVDQPVLEGLMESRPDEGHINLFRGLVRQLRAHMDVDEPGCVVTVDLPPLI